MSQPDANPYAPPRSDVGLGNQVQPTASGLAAGMPMPPDLHWALILLLSSFSWGIFYYIWIFVQAAWIKRIDPSSRVVLLQIAIVVLTIAGWTVAIVSSDDPAVAGTILLATSVGSMALFIWAIFSVRSSMRSYFNSAVPIGLRLSGVMTFFFHTLYFQHHMSRLARWKKTGVLTPQ